MNNNPDFIRWSIGRCLYECDFCGAYFPQSWDFWRHVVNHHHLQRGEYKTACGDPIVDDVLLVCGYCKEEIRHDYGDMMDHLKLRHSEVGLYEYYRRFYEVRARKGKRKREDEVVVETKG